MKLSSDWVEWPTVKSSVKMRPLNNRRDNFIVTALKHSADFPSAHAN
jgi:hypothetical protein